ncbi:ATPase AAA [Candidatus Magnetomorum sp. HK-1]|nr:ATPase AAA [Candidatus Magnetomorum sp. HK-1]
MHINLLKELILEQKALQSQRKTGIERVCLQKIETHVLSSHIIIVSGIRRCGKSTLLEQIMEKYYNNNEYYYFNFEDERLLNFTVDDFNNLYEAFLELYGERKVFFFDEIQNVNKWEAFIRRMHDAGFKIFLTGSNASMLSREIGTRLTGRHIQIMLTPFSFNEYLHFKAVYPDDKMLLTNIGRAKIKKYFNEYLIHGGLPEYLKYNDSAMIQHLYNDILYRDIAARYDIKDVRALRDLSFYLVSNIATGISYNRLASMIGLGSVNTVKSYLEYLENSYLTTFILKFDASVRKQMMNQRKVYVADNGIARLASINFFENRGPFLENLVFNELNRRYDRCFYYKTTKNKEVDFYIHDNHSVSKLIQVSDSLRNGKTRTREIGSLVEAMEECKLKTGFVLTSDEEEIITEKGKTIQVLPIYKWLINSADNI